MKAAIKTKQERQIIIQQVELPMIKQNEVLIKVDYCGVCGSDLHAYNHATGYEFVNSPVILGHEISGEVIDVFDESLKYLMGKRVIVESMQYCGQCEYCKKGRKQICKKINVIGLHYDGGMAEMVKTDVRFVREIPEQISNLEAALTEPMTIGVHAVNIADIQEGQEVLVQGPGIIGIFVSLVCLEKKAKVTLSGLEKDYENRLSKVTSLDISTHVVGKEKLTKEFDLFFECSGANPAVHYGFDHLKKGGKAVFVAMYEQTINVFLSKIIRNEWPLLTSYGCNPEEYETSFKIIERYSDFLKNIISIYPLDETSQAFYDGLHQNVLKPIISMRS